MNAKIDVAIAVLICDLFIFSYTGEVFAPFLSCLSSVPGVVHYCTPVFVIVCYLIKNAFQIQKIKNGCQFQQNYAEVSMLQSCVPIHGVLL